MSQLYGQDILFEQLQNVPFYREKIRITRFSVIKKMGNQMLD